MDQQLTNVLTAGGFTVVGAILGASITSMISSKNVRFQMEESKRKESSKFFLDECLLLLERAYEIFTSKGDNPPKSDRTLWGTTAILIVRFQDMKKRITEGAHIVIVHEHEDYWRHKLASVLIPFRSDLQEGYFAPKGWEDVRTRISRTSIAVILDFADWREDLPNPLKKVDYKTLLARLGATSYPHLVHQILDAHPGDREDVRNLMEAYYKKHKEKYSWYFGEK